VVRWLRDGNGSERDVESKRVLRVLAGQALASHDGDAVYIVAAASLT
jgi:hypothetical protein